MSAARPRSRLVVLLFAVPFLALAGVVTVGVWGRLVDRIAPLDGVVVAQGPGGRAGPCEVVVRGAGGGRQVLRPDERGCQVLAVGRRVTKPGWSVTYRTDGGDLWRLPATELWLGGVLGSLFTGAWVVFVVAGVVSLRRRAAADRGTLG